MGRKRVVWARDPEEVFDFAGLGVEGTFTRSEGPWRIVGCPGCGGNHYNDEDCIAFRVVPLGRDPANAKVKEWHRHHKAVVGYKFALGVEFGNALVGIAIVGRPVSRMLDDGLTLEVTRVATTGTFNACSKLYASCAAAAKGMGVCDLITYTLPDEGGASLRAAGWTDEGVAGGGSWSRSKRKRVDKAPIVKKNRWRKGLNPRPPTE
jgi:hypothetical protein